MPIKAQFIYFSNIYNGNIQQLFIFFMVQEISRA